MPECFVIMPITTPPTVVDTYGGDRAHFAHVMEHLFKPAIEQAGYTAIPAVAEGADLIHAEIVRRLETSELLLCDVSTLNPNVFFELGIRTALDKSVCLVRDDQTPALPFDTALINCHTYHGALNPWELPDDVEALANHLRTAAHRSEGRNALWRYFGLTERGAGAAESLDDQSIAPTLDLLLAEVRELRRSPSDSGSSNTSYVRRGNPNDRRGNFVQVAETIAGEISARLEIAEQTDDKVVFDLSFYTLDRERRDLIKAVGVGYGYAVEFIGGDEI